MVMEDLTSRNFVLASRKERLDYDRAKLVVEKMAKLHAVSMILYDKEPSSMEYHKMSAMDGDEPTALTFFFSVSQKVHYLIYFINLLN